MLILAACRPYFKRLNFISYPPLYLSGLHPSPLHLRCEVLFSLVIVYLASLLFFQALSRSWLVCLHPLSHLRYDSSLSYNVSAPQTCDDALPPWFDGSCPSRGCKKNSFLPCPYCDKLNHHANKCWKQFDNPPSALEVVTHSATFSPSSPNTPTLQYHVTLTSAKYGVFFHSGSTDASASASLTSPHLWLSPHQVYPLSLPPSPL